MLNVAVSLVVLCVARCVRGSGPCEPKNVHLEIYYVQDRSLSFCGVETCAYADHPEDSLTKSEAIKRDYFDMMESLQSEFRSLKLGYSEFIDKPLRPFGQDGADFCLKFVNPMYELGSDYRSFIEGHWDSTWDYSGSGVDILQNQLDAMIAAMMRGEFTEGNFSPDGKIVLKVLFLITDTYYHQKGEYECPGGCRDYEIDARCNCRGVDYPSIQQFLDVAVRNRINILFNIQDPVYPGVVDHYDYLIDMLKYTDPTLVGTTLVGGIKSGARHVFAPEMIKDAVLNILSDRCVAAMSAQ